jgi:protoheme IX farnesyltransferase
MKNNAGAKIEAYYRLTKPGIVYGNALMYAAGFFLAAREGIDWQLFVGGLAGISLVIGSACVFNNIADRELDSKMPRTQKRALPAGKISVKDATVFGYLLAITGFLDLYLLTSFTAFFTALVGFAVYVFAYTPMKPRNRYALFVGAIAGAVPPVVGYTVITDVYDGWALLLFILLFVWQIPHFVAIAFYRYEDYTAAGVPLFARAPKNEKERKIAKQVFAASLVILLVGCLGVALWRLLL